MNPILAAILPLVGALLGATVQYLLSRSNELQKQVHALKNQAYVDFLRAVSQVAHATSRDEVVKAHLLAAEAKARIVVYGDEAVIATLAEFERTGAQLNNEPAYNAFLRLASTMRGKGAQVDIDALALILFGPKRAALAAAETALLGKDAAPDSPPSEPPPSEPEV